MRTLVFIRSNGLISHTLKTAIEDDFLDGTFDDEGLFIKEVPGLDLSGKYWKSTGWTDLPPQPDAHHRWSGVAWVFKKDECIEQAKDSRNSLLAACDWTVLPDSPLSAEKQAEWQTYRQVLRDLPAGLSNITNAAGVVWPTSPA